MWKTHFYSEPVAMAYAKIWISIDQGQEQVYFVCDGHPVHQYQQNKQ
jgi:hypothetical protein